MSTPINFKSKEALIEALEDKRPIARALDKRDKDRADAKLAAEVKRFKADCQKYAKMSVKDLMAEAASFDNEHSYWAKGLRVESVEGPRRADTCRNTREAKLDRSIRSVSAGTQERFTISGSGMWREVHDLLSLAEDGCS